MHHVLGNTLEGGGQILRQAMLLGALLGKSVHIDHIRAGRSKPGLAAQHVAGLRLLQDLIPEIHMEHVELQSQQCTLVIEEDRCRAWEPHHEAAVQGAGSTALMLQIIQPICVFAPVATEIVLKGGTDADMAPPIEWIQRVLAPTLKRIQGIHFDLILERRGFFPKGGGVVKAKTVPFDGVLPAFELVERGYVKRIEGVVVVSRSLSSSIAERMERSTREVLMKWLEKKSPHTPIAIEKKVEECIGAGCSITLVAHTSTDCRIGSSAIGQKGKSAEVIGRNVAQDLIQQLLHGGCVDVHLQDQLLLYMALADGRSRMRSGPISLHSRTSIEYLLPMFTQVKFDVSSEPDGSHIISCDGIAYRSRWSRG